ncbi:hypothetical protein DAETH_20730 [Deinococcus aetherius]|uniref:Uncharacterized protein n=1 Tax=Deinococcus aetherius TaxID=200252 RepID=A0ABM8AEF3_9DEIO|nr:hypothetical protein DAETH_20730 [Deinococcus aetherius]
MLRRPVGPFSTPVIPEWPAREQASPEPQASEKSARVTVYQVSPPPGGGQAPSIRRSKIT